MEDSFSGCVADHLRRRAAGIDICTHQYRRHRISYKLRRAWTINYGSRRAIRSRRHLCRNLFCHTGQHPVFHGVGKGRTMAEAGRLTRIHRPAPVLNPVMLLRVALVLALLTVWEVLSRSGWLYRDVVPSLFKVAAAVYALLSTKDYYFNLGVTSAEIGAALLIGGLSGIAVGLLLGANRFLAKAYEPFLYYLGPTPKIIFFP